MENLAALEPCLQTPTLEVSAGKIKRIAKLGEHVERHQEAERILPTLVINQVLNGHEGAPVGRAL
jgi:hypothetical protein